MSDHDYGFRDSPATDDSRWRADEEQAHADHLHEDAVELYRERTGFGDPKHPSFHDRYSDIWDMREGK